MRWVVRLLLLTLAIVPVAALALLLFALSDAPLVTNTVALTPDHIERAKRLLQRTDPRRMRPGVLRSIAVTGEDLDLAVNYLANRYARGAAHVVLQEGAASARATFELPANPVGRYLNVRALFSETTALPRLDELRIGRVTVPGFLRDWLVREGLMRWQSHPQYASAADVVKRVSARGGSLQVVFAWDETALGQLKAALVSPQDQARWQLYQTRLAEVAARLPAGRRVPLPALLAPLLQLAAQQSGNGDAAAGNRAALVVLAFYVNGKGLAALVPAARDWPEAAPRVVTLAGRTDTPLHFMISAALAASAGTPLSDAVGLYKEVDDARGGSGFSFNDIAADRAGARLGELAAASEDGAVKLHRLSAGGLVEGDLLPEIRDLPESMPQAEFKRRYGGPGQPAFARQMAEIERRIARLRLYR